MGKPTGFLEFSRELARKRPVSERINDYKEIDSVVSSKEVETQAARCMDCGVPFCHNGCPLGNIIPEFNDAVYEKNWEYAYKILASTNNFPEFTGRICPAPCESSCVLGINKPPVSIEYIEKAIIEHAFSHNLVKPKLPIKRTGKKVAIIGSGPAGLAAAAQLNKAGHQVVVFERADKIGGLLRYGIPDFKLEKWVVDRRVELMRSEGIEFRVNATVGKEISTAQVLEDYEAVVLCGGSTVPRDILAEGRNLKGIYPAMEFLSQQNKRIATIGLEKDHQGKFYTNGSIEARGKHVVVIGGGDTGSDCVGTSNRQKAKSVTQIELLPMPPKERDASTPWPQWPLMVRSSSSHEEGCERKWAIQTLEFIGNENKELVALKIADVEWIHENGKMNLKTKQDSERQIPCDLALIAAGFLHPESTGLIEELGVALDERGNVRSENYRTTVAKVFVAGDMRRGQSLVVWAISEGREAARAVDEFLIGEPSLLEAKEISMFEM